MIKRFIFIVVLFCFAFRSLYSFGHTFINEPFQLLGNDTNHKLIVYSADNDIDNSELPFDLKEKDETEIEGNEEDEHLPLYFIKLLSDSDIVKLIGFNNLNYSTAYLIIKTHFSPIYIFIHSFII